METNNYIYAIVKIPILLTENEKIETLNDYIQIEFEKCDNLPEKNIHPVNNDIVSRIKEILNSDELEENNTNNEETPLENTCSSDEEHETKEEKDTLTITLNELLNKPKRKPSQNATFKKYKSRHLRNTMRVNP
jgi:hypothetical protein